jgi:hypothetical protein
MAGRPGSAKAGRPRAPTSALTDPRTDLPAPFFRRCFASPAVANAVADAIGARIQELPPTPERVLRAIQTSRHA